MRDDLVVDSSLSNVVNKIKINSKLYRKNIVRSCFKTISVLYTIRFK